MAAAALGLEVDCDDEDSDSNIDSAFGSDTNTISREQLSGSRVLFWNQLKNEQLQTDNYNCLIHASQKFLFL